MPLLPKQPLRWHCEKCAWKADHLIRSDVITPLVSCPKCGAKTVLKPESGVLDGLLSLFNKGRG